MTVYCRVAVTLLSDFTIESSTRSFRIRSDPEKSNAQSQNSQQFPSQEAKIQAEQTPLISHHDPLGFSDCFHHRQVLIFCHNIGCHGIPVQSNISRNHKQDGPEHNHHAAEELHTEAFPESADMGKQISQGLTLSASYYIIQKLDQRFSWLVRGNLRTQKTKLDKIGNKLDELNKSGQGHNTVRYYNGADPDDIWAVKSAGIDPSTGRELFYDKEGNYTYDFSYDNEVICGNTRPKIEGVIGTSLNYKGFSVSMNFRYQTGASVFNEALFNKVENISVSGLNKNQDKRALYERWQNPGDKVRFKDIANAASTPMSSRFIQKENVLSMESVYVGYEFYEGWIKKIGLSNLKIQASMRDVFRASTIKSERGTLYPFARSLELGLSFNF